MLVGTHQSTAEADDLVIEISNTRLEIVNKFKYLGVLNNTLSWKDHIEYISNKISSSLSCAERVRFFPSQLVKCSPILWSCHCSITVRLSGTAVGLGAKLM